MIVLRLALIAIALWLFAPTGARAELSEDEQRLLTFLDKEYAAGFFTIGNRGQDASGAYRWAATFHRELRKPLEKLQGFCAKEGGILQLALSAGQISDRRTSALIGLGGRSYIVKHHDLWEWEARGYDSVAAGISGFNEVIPRQLLTGRTRTIAAADAAPPMGLFACARNDNEMLWAASIMPGAYGGSGWFYMSIRAITSDYLEMRDRQKYEAERLSRKATEKVTADARAVDAFVASENMRLAGFRKSLTIGSDTNCGLVINDRGPVLEVQLPSSITGPNGERQFWTKRGSLTDAKAPRGCTFGRD
jgi:hypothetical protein